MAQKAFNDSLSKRPKAEKSQLGYYPSGQKSSRHLFNNNAHWDLVDTLREGVVDETDISEIDDLQLPDSMKGLSSAEKSEYLRNKEKERRAIKQEIKRQSELRADYVAKVKREQVAASPTMSDALTKAIEKQAEQKNFEFEKTQQQYIKRKFYRDLTSGSRSFIAQTIFTLSPLFLHIFQLKLIMQIA